MDVTLALCGSTLNIVGLPRVFVCLEDKILADYMVVTDSSDSHYSTCLYNGLTRGDSHSETEIPFPLIEL
jgi:hypothetical protein